MFFDKTSADQPGVWRNIEYTIILGLLGTGWMFLIFGRALGAFKGQSSRLWADEAESKLETVFKDLSELGMLALAFPFLAYFYFFITTPTLISHVGLDIVGYFLGHERSLPLAARLVIWGIVVGPLLVVGLSFVAGQLLQIWGRKA
jgi:hypothetical protein